MRCNVLSLFFLFLSFQDVIAGVKEITPTPILTIAGLGNGYSTPAITSDRIFVTGEKGGTGYLFAYDFKGVLLWKTEYGREWAANYPGSRSTPTVCDSVIYTSSGMGDIACFDIKNGKKLWSVNMIRDMHGVNAVFGYSIPVLVDNGRIYCLPGGEDTNVACLDSRNGKILWTAKGNGETPGYTSPLIIRKNQRSILVAFSELTLLGLDAITGELLWTDELSIKGNAPCNTPIYSGGFLYIVAGMGNGAAKFSLSNDGSAVTRVWTNEEFDTYFGGFTKVGNYLFGSSESNRAWLSMDSETGKTVDSLSFRTGSTTQAGEDLVLYNQAGKVGIVSHDNGKMTLLKSFLVTNGSKEHFAHPLFAGGRLFIRRGDVLLVYDYQQIKTL